MGFQRLIPDQEQQQEYLARFTQGDEKILAFMYQHTFGLLLHYGLQHLNDEFAVTNIIHECFLKAWSYRATMQSLPHIYRFIRLNMKWHFQKYYASNRYRFYRQTFLMERPEEEAAHIADEPFATEPTPDEQRLQQIYKVIPYLPINRQTITQLHFGYGMSHKQIAKRMGSTNTAIMLELKKCIASLKDMVGSNKPAPKRRIPNKSIPVANTLPAAHTEVYRRRMEQGQSFDEIAAATGLCRQQVVQHYVQACKTIKQTTTRKRV